MGKSFKVLHLQLNLNGFAVEVGYLNWYQQQSTGNDFFNRHIVTFNLSKSFDFSGKKE